MQQIAEDTCLPVDIEAQPPVQAALAPAAGDPQLSRGDRARAAPAETFG